MKEIKYKLKRTSGKKKKINTNQFGLHFTDHVFEMDYSPKNKWHNPVIKALEHISLHPATIFFHYGQVLFEGIKAFNTVNSKIVIFRPGEHFERLNKTAKRICIPEIDAEFITYTLSELLKIERKWIPTKKGESLYIRPIIFGSDKCISVKPSLNYKLIIFLSPAGNYYQGGFKPIKVLIQDEYVRAVRKGLGNCKTPANYVASLLATEKAKEKGYTDVLWLDAIEQKFVEEAGTMNIFFRYKNEIVTPVLTGSILPGITRKTVINILRNWNLPISERNIALDEIIEEYKKNNLLEVFGTGTAAVITPIGWMTYKNEKIKINNGEPGELSIKLYNEITSIQYGEKEDKNKWLFYIE